MKGNDVFDWWPVMCSSMVYCADDRTGLCAPCVSKNRNGAFSFLEQLAKSQLFPFFELSSKNGNVSINGLPIP